ncbi:MAG: Crp/Fnr family transcriptional regulator [Chromatiaceae bacterium]|nr:Crp/Fnr family transcriptional regulator [Chromatiaceae bacterium]
MSAPALTLPTNRLLEGLTPQARTWTLAQCERVELVAGDMLCEADEPYTHAYFPLRGVIALVTIMDPYRPLEMGLIGNEGMLGATLALGVGTAPMRALVQGAGTAWRIPRDRFQQALLASPDLRRIIYRYLYVRLTQSAQAAACTHFHEIEPRLARWLLMTQDRAHADHFHLTHEVLATLLGVRRSGITLAAGSLQQRGLIRYVRGNIRILDRPGLEAAACGCYVALLADYAEQFAEPGAPGAPRQRAAPPPGNASHRVVSAGDSRSRRIRHGCPPAPPSAR